MRGQSRITTGRITMIEVTASACNLGSGPTSSRTSRLGVLVPPQSIFPGWSLMPSSQAMTECENSFSNTRHRATAPP